MSEIKGFPLFSLPYLALKDVILSFDIFSRLNVSLCSKKSRKIAGSYKMPELQVGMDLCEDSKNIVRVIQVKTFPEMGISHTLNVIPTDVKEDFGKVIQTSEFEWEFYHDPSVNLTEILCNRFLRFYDLDSLRGVTFRKDVEQSDFNKFPVLLLNAPSIAFGKKQVKKEDLDQLFLRHRNIQSVALNDPYPEGYDNFGIWRSKDFWLRGTLPKIEHLLEMDYEKAVCRRANYKNSDINRFLKKWLQSRQQNGMYLKREIQISKVENDSNIFEDLPVIPWNPKQRSQFFHYRNPFLNAAVDCSKSFDLLRDDGVLASVMIRDGSFSFSIWNERFPDIPKSDFFPSAVFY